MQTPKLCATERLVLMSLVSTPNQNKDSLRETTGAGIIGIHNALRTLVLLGRIIRADDASYSLAPAVEGGE